MAIGCIGEPLIASRQRSPPGYECKLGEQREKTYCQWPAVQLSVSHYRGRMDGCALHQIDLSVDVLKRGCVAGAEVSAASHTRNVAEQRFIDLHWLVLVAQAPVGVAPDGYGRHSNAAHPDSIDLYSVRLGRFRRNERLDGPAIVDAVGEEDHHA